MPEVALFCEDSFHEKFVQALLARLSFEYGAGARPRLLSGRGGLPTLHREFKKVLRDIDRGRLSRPDAIIVVADGNCKEYTDRKELFDNAARHYPSLLGLVSYAIPEPHIERWMLVDPDAFRSVFRRGCTLPALKCSKDEYKNLLRREIRKSGIIAPLGGEEFAEDIVSELAGPPEPLTRFC